MENPSPKWLYAAAWFSSAQRHGGSCPGWGGLGRDVAATVKAPLTFDSSRGALRIVLDTTRGPHSSPVTPWGPKRWRCGGRGAGGHYIPAISWSREKLRAARRLPEEKLRRLAAAAHQLVSFPFPRAVRGQCRRCISVVFEDIATTEPPCLRAGAARASSRASEGLGAGRWPDWFLRGAHSWHKRKRYWPLAAARLSSARVPAASAHTLLLHSYRAARQPPSNMFWQSKAPRSTSHKQPLQSPTFLGGWRSPSPSFSFPAGVATAAPATKARGAGTVSRRGCPGGCHGE
ncbi:hypothetical protein E2C01_070736 [Portunus trituberculatus]|uniref:Uncharacterized protein n=1 Tax=Portunus trituberculatus TaxID=210409 RepID=A0A5B7I2F7_PORTR|nr:hypothetical protein [Portunus trituberculatus]